MRARLATAATLAALLAATGTATATSPPRGPRFAHTTVVTATGPSSVRLYLPAKASIRYGSSGSPNLSVTGDGRVVGAVLVSERGTALVGLFVGDCATAGCRAARRTPVFTFPDAIESRVSHPRDHIVIHYDAGWYRLYLLTDGAPVTATLTLPGLGGSTRVVAREPARLTWSGQALPGLPAGSVTASGAITAETGLAASAVVVATPVNPGGAASVCWTGESGGAAYCADADTNHDPEPAEPVGRPFAYAAGHRVSRGTWSQQVRWATAPGSAAHVVQLWLDLVDRAGRR